MWEAAGSFNYTALHPRKWLSLAQTLSVIFKNFNPIICGFQIMENSINRVNNQIGALCNVFISLLYMFRET